MEMIKRKERESMAMTYKKLKEIIERNGVPEDVHLMSNSGWECSATEMEFIGTRRLTKFTLYRRVITLRVKSIRLRIEGVKEGSIGRGGLY